MEQPDQLIHRGMLNARELRAQYPSFLIDYAKRYHLPSGLTVDECVSKIFASQDDEYIPILPQHLWQRTEKGVVIYGTRETQLAKSKPSKRTINPDPFVRFPTPSDTFTSPPPSPPVPSGIGLTGSMRSSEYTGESGSLPYLEFVYPPRGRRIEKKDEDDEQQYEPLQERWLEEMLVDVEQERMGVREDLSELQRELKQVMYDITMTSIEVERERKCREGLLDLVSAIYGEDVSQEIEEMVRQDVDGDDERHGDGGHDWPKGYDEDDDSSDEDDDSSDEDDDAPPGAKSKEHKSMPTTPTKAARGQSSLEVDTAPPSKPIQPASVSSLETGTQGKSKKASTSKFAAESNSTTILPTSGPIRAESSGGRLSQNNVAPLPRLSLKRRQRAPYYASDADSDSAASTPGPSTPVDAPSVAQDPPRVNSDYGSPPPENTSVAGISRLGQSGSAEHSSTHRVAFAPGTDAHASTPSSKVQRELTPFPVGPPSVRRSPRHKRSRDLDNEDEADDESSQCSSAESSGPVEPRQKRVKMIEADGSESDSCPTPNSPGSPSSPSPSSPTRLTASAVAKILPMISIKRKRDDDEDSDNGSRWASEADESEERYLKRVRAHSHGTWDEVVCV